MLRLILPLYLVLGGCASLDEVVGGIANTPEWFQNRRVEIRGEGYPDLTEVPSEDSVEGVSLRLTSIEKDARAGFATFLSDPRTEAAHLSLEEITQRQQSLQRRLSSEAPDQTDAVLTDADLDALREKLRVPPIAK